MLRRSNPTSGQGERVTAPESLNAPAGESTDVVEVADGAYDAATPYGAWRVCGDGGGGGGGGVENGA